jgi:uncharacterized protein (TIGR02598 family)
MDNLTPCIHSFKRSRESSQRAFSLIEIVIAIGIIAVAVIPLVGLLPSGLGTFRQSIETSVGSQIAQKVINDAQQTNYDLLTAAAGAENNTSGATFTTIIKPLRYFDADGMELTTLSGSIYQVNTVVNPTTLPGLNTPNYDLATVIVQVAHNPTGIVLNTTSGGLWLPSTLSVSTYTALVGRNK